MKLRVKSAPTAPYIARELNTEFSPIKVKTISVPAVTDGENSNAVIFTDADYIGCDALIITPTSLPPDGMSGPIAWISNPTTGEAIARFTAVGDSIPAESQDFVCIGIRLP